MAPEERSLQVWCEARIESQTSQNVVGKGFPKLKSTLLKSPNSARIEFLLFFDGSAGWSGKRRLNFGPKITDFFPTFWTLEGLFFAGQQQGNWAAFEEVFTLSEFPF